MTYDEEVVEELLGNFNLLCSIIRQTKNPEMKVDLGKIEDIIKNKIPNALKKNAPEDFYVLYTDFKSEYEKFKDFILYDKLIRKNIIALGGGFSSGKSSFLNALMKKNVLPADIDPSTSVPTYIVSGDKHHVQGINVFDTKIDMEVRSIRKIAHGFGKVEDEGFETVTSDVTLGHVLNSIFFSTPLHSYKNIAFLDTPGYSKPDSEKYSAKTDEQISRGQLNSSNFILWFVQADAGTITEEDIKFIKTLREDIPKLIILNKADKKPEKDIIEIISKIKSVMDLKGVRYVDVLAFSNKEPDGYDGAKIRKHLESWNEQVYKSNFARNFKVLFVRCKEFYEEEIEEEGRRLNRLNKARTLSEDSTVTECLDSLIAEIKKNIASLKDISTKLKELQTEFFTEIKFISDIVGIAMPEPSEIDLIQDKVQDPLKLIEDYKKKKGIKTDSRIVSMLQEAFADIKPVINKSAGGSKYKNELLEVIRTNCSIYKNKIKFNDVYKNTEEYKELIKEVL